MGCTELYRRDCPASFNTMLVTLGESHESQKRTNYNRAMGVGLLHEYSIVLKFLDIEESA
jgi:hypothetical protein